jgi:hypothetical protein
MSGAQPLARLVEQARAQARQTPANDHRTRQLAEIIEEKMNSLFGPFTEHKQRPDAWSQYRTLIPELKAAQGAGYENFDEHVQFVLEGLDHPASEVQAALRGQYDSLHPSTQSAMAYAVGGAVVAYVIDVLLAEESASR